MHQNYLLDVAIWLHVSKRVLKAYPLFIETLEDGLHEVTCSMPENTIVNTPVCTAEAHVYNTGSIAEQWHCKNSTSLGEHYKTNPAFFCSTLARH